MSYEEVQDKVVYVRLLSGHDLIGIDNEGVKFIAHHGHLMLSDAYALVINKDGSGGFIKPWPFLKGLDVSIPLNMVVVHGEPEDEIKEAYLVAVHKKPELLRPSGKLVLPHD